MSAAIAVATLGLLAPNALRFTDVKSGRDVVLIGCMHFNPASIRAVESVVGDLASDGDLGAILVESCPARWDALIKERESSRLRPDEDEMQVAAAMAEASGCGFALADQSIDVTTGRLAQLCKASVVQLCTPFGGGWRLIGRDIASGWAALQPDDDDGVSPLAFVDALLTEFCVHGLGMRRAKATAFTVRSLVELPAGHEVFDTYGAKSNDFMLQTYGFIVAETADFKVS